MAFIAGQKHTQVEEITWLAIHNGLGICLKNKILVLVGKGLQEGW